MRVVLHSVLRNKICHIKKKEKNSKVNPVDENCRPDGKTSGHERKMMESEVRVLRCEVM